MKRIVLALMLVLLVVFLVAGCTWFRGPNQSPESGTEPDTVGEAPRLGAVYFFDPQTGWVAGKGEILTTVDGGATWTRQYSGDDNFQQLDFVDRSTGWALAEDTLLRTADGGKTWRNAEVPGDEKLHVVDFIDIRTGWLVTGESLFQSKDGGQTWIKVEVPAPPQTACRPFGALGWMVSGKDVYRTETGGMTWLKSMTAPLEGDGWQPRLSCRENSVLVLFTGEAAMSQQAYAAFLTRDDGNTWTPILKENYFSSAYPSLDNVTEEIDSYAGRFQLVDRNTARLLGSCPARDGRVSLTSTNDGGKTWTHHNIDELQGAMDLALWFVDADRGWVVGTKDDKGIIVTTDDGGATWTRQLPK